MGPPASGKSTQSKFLSASLEIPSLSVGDFLRERSREDNDLRQALNNGEIIADEVILEALKQIHTKHADNIIVDGAPRRASQVNCFLKFWEPKQITAIHLNVPDSELLERITHRVTTTGEKRADDSPEVAAHRIELYHQMAPDIIATIDNHGIKRIDINGDQEPEQVHATIMESI